MNNYGDEMSDGNDDFDLGFVSMEDLHLSRIQVVWANIAARAGELAIAISETADSNQDFLDAAALAEISEACWLKQTGEDCGPLSAMIPQYFPTPTEGEPK